MTADEVLALARENAVEFVDLRFVTLTGRTGHTTLPIEELSASAIQRGVAGGAAVPNDRLLVPATDTAVIDPFCQHSTLALLCDVMIAATGDDAPDDPRAVARRAQEHLRATGIADEARFGVEIEFFVFDQVCYEQQVNAARYQVDSREGAWQSGRDEPDNLGTQLRYGAGAHALPPADNLHNLRAEMVAALTACGIHARGHRHGAATGGQAAIRLAPVPLLRAADQVTTCKYVVRNVAARHGKVATFMPKPLAGEHGSGLAASLSLVKGEQPLLCDPERAALREAGRWAAGGWTRHATSLLALTCPTTNSYRRLAAEFRAPRTPARVPPPSLEIDGLAFPVADPSCNPYLAFSALLMAALDGIAGRVDAGPSDAHRLPGGLEDALRGLTRDHAYLCAAGVFHEEMIREWDSMKRHDEVLALSMRPHPYEFCLYFDV